MEIDLHKIFDTSISLKTAISILENNGYEAYLVGGCVRDNLLAVAPKDYDITTNALPSQVIAAFNNYKIIVIGLKHGTVIVIIEDMPIEITTYRVDGEYTDNRRPDNVSFTRDLKEDLARRDFTINALAYNNKDGIIDFFGGIEDLKNKIIRCVGIPDQRFNEDALRILRALRFSSVLGFEIQTNTAESIHKNKKLLLNIANERISIEFSKLLCGDNKEIEKILIEYIDVFGVFIPELLPMKGFDQNNNYHIYDVYKHSVKAVINTPKVLMLRLSAFFHDIGKPLSYSQDNKGTGHFYGHSKKSEEMVRIILRRLKFDNSIIEIVSSLVLYHDITIEVDEKKIKHVLNNFSYDVYKSLIALKRADILSQNPKFLSRLETLDKIEKMIDKIISEGQCYTIDKLEIDGNDLIKLKIPQGNKLGKTLDYLLTAVINGDFPNEREILLNKAEKYFKQIEKHLP